MSEIYSKPRQCRFQDTVYSTTEEYCILQFAMFDWTKWSFHLINISTSISCLMEESSVLQRIVTVVYVTQSSHAVTKSD